ncbi:uncharacterized protein LOC140706048 isoform X2 [Pogona vitticeps]
MLLETCFFIYGLARTEFAVLNAIGNLPTFGLTIHIKIKKKEKGDSGSSYFPYFPGRATEEEENLFPSPPQTGRTAVEANKKKANEKGRATEEEENLFPSPPQTGRTAVEANKKKANEKGSVGAQRGGADGTLGGGVYGARTSGQEVFVGVPSHPKGLYTVVC